MKHSKHFLFVPMLFLFVLWHHQPLAVTQVTPVIVSDGTFNPDD